METAEIAHAVTVLQDIEDVFRRFSATPPSEIFRHLTRAILDQPENEGLRVDVLLVGSTPPTAMCLEVRKGEDVHTLGVTLAPEAGGGATAVHASFSSESRGLLVKGASSLAGLLAVDGALREDLLAFAQRSEEGEGLLEKLQKAVGNGIGLCI